MWEKIELECELQLTKNAWNSKTFHISFRMQSYNTLHSNQSMHFFMLGENGNT